jgi:hypothetical protein
VDEENHPEDALERLYGLGLRARDHDRVRVICQQSLDLTAVPDLEALTHEVEMFRPALVIIDGALSAAPSLDPSDNGQVTRLLKALRRTAQDADCGLVLLAHVPKHSRDDDDDAVLGANAWRTQVDAAFRSVRRGGSGHYTRQSLDAGHVDETYRYELRSSSKVRWGAGHGRACPFRTRSERNEDGALLWLRVEQDGDVRAKSSNREPSPTKREQVRQQVAALIAERRRITTAELVAALPDVAERTLKRVLAEDGEGLWTRPTEGVYEATEERA